MSKLQIIAHRGGNQNWPENTLCAFRQNVAAGVDGIEIDVQTTKEGVAVVYHPDDLSQWTNSSGPIAEKTTEEVTALDASVKYKANGNFQKVCRAEDLKIPTLENVLKQIPNVPLIIDMKSLPADRLVNALFAAIPEGEWKRLRFYSTTAEHTSKIRQRKPDAVVFEDRGVTFQRLMMVNATRQCTQPNKTQWVAYELVRDLNVCDKTKLGSTCIDKLPMEMWTPESVQCTRNMTGAQLVFFGINDKESFERAQQLGAAAVLTDNPAALLPLRKISDQ